MNSRFLSAITRALSGAGEAISTPSGVNVDLLRGYGRHNETGLPHYFGNKIPD